MARHCGSAVGVDADGLAVTHLSRCFVGGWGVLRPTGPDLQRLRDAAEDYGDAAVVRTGRMFRSVTFLERGVPFAGLGGLRRADAGGLVRWFRRARPGAAQVAMVEGKDLYMLLGLAGYRHAVQGRAGRAAPLVSRSTPTQEWVWL